jgi:hypothetical protein
MDLMMKTNVEPMQAACEAHALHWRAADFRTLRRYFLDFMLPILTVAAMSALTIVMLVLIVSAVADMGLSSQTRQTSPDPWSAACFGPAFLWDRQVDLDSGARTDMMDQDEDSPAEPWPGPQTNDQLDVPWARWTPE